MIDPGIQDTDQYDILIVDDSPDSLELLGRILEEHSYRVRPAPNGRIALKSVAARLPNLILLDVKMPEMDGEHLEDLVRGRTAQLEAANKEMHAFTYTVSHDLRVPLRHIDGFIELLQKKADTVIDEQGRHYMAAISEAAQKMGLLIDDLLSFSRMGRHHMTAQQVDLGRLVRDILREFEPDTAGRRIDWRIGDLPVVSGDSAMLRVVLVNLISNALKFTCSREKAAIEIGSLSDQTSETVMFVNDNGVGFDMTYVDKLFGIFQRLHNADEFGGTGIGLANVRRIIARHGGRT